MTKPTPPKNIVLYADDDVDDLLLVQEAFSRYAANVEVVTARDGAEALSFLKNLSEYDPTPCLIILDINMPRMNGKEALVNLRKMERFEEVPALLFTTSSLPVDEAFASSYNAGFLTKPIDVRQMEVITQQFIDHCTEQIRNNIRRQIK